VDLRYSRSENYGNYYYGTKGRDYRSQFRRYLHHIVGSGSSTCGRWKACESTGANWTTCASAAVSDNAPSKRCGSD
jgi:hypothetical protein